MKAKATFFTIFCCILVSCAGMNRGSSPLLLAIPTASLRGVVLGKNNDKPIARADVFLDGTTLRTQTDADGGFLFAEVPLGAHRLIVSSRERTSTTPLILRELREHQVTVELLTAPEREQNCEDRVQTLESEVTQLRAQLSEQRKALLMGRGRAEESKALKIFRQILVGRTSQTSVLNPEVIESEVEPGGGNQRISYSAEEPVLIENRRLGYMVIVGLKSAHVFKSRGLYTMSYRATTSFTELKPVDDKERLRWIRNRKKAFFGSLRHFLISFAGRRLSEQGFMILQPASDVASGASTGVPGLSRDPFSAFSPVRNPYSMLSMTEDGTAFVLSFRDFIQIINLADGVEPHYLDFRGVDADAQTSMLSFLDGPLQFTATGIPLDFNGLSKSGYWSVEQFSGLLPLDYFPSIDP